MTFFIPRDIWKNILSMKIQLEEFDRYLERKKNEPGRDLSFTEYNYRIETILNFQDYCSCCMTFKDKIFENIFKEQYPNIDVSNSECFFLIDENRRIVSYVTGIYHVDSYASVVFLVDDYNNIQGLEKILEKIQKNLIIDETSENQNGIHFNCFIPPPEYPIIMDLLDKVCTNISRYLI
jgi:hypothetical protein